MKKALSFIIATIFLTMMIGSTTADPYACAACITTNAAACIAGCSSAGLPQLILACSLECEVVATYSRCGHVC
jgi:hypothetical protein